MRFDSDYAEYIMLGVHVCKPQTHTKDLDTQLVL